MFSSKTHGLTPYGFLLCVIKKIRRFPCFLKKERVLALHYLLCKNAYMILLALHYLPCKNACIPLLALSCKGVCVALLALSCKSVCVPLLVLACKGVCLAKVCACPLLVLPCSYLVKVCAYHCLLCLAKVHCFALKRVRGFSCFSKEGKNALLVLQRCIEKADLQ